MGRPLCASWPGNSGTLPDALGRLPSLREFRFRPIRSKSFERVRCRRTQVREKSLAAGHVRHQLQVSVSPVARASPDPGLLFKCRTENNATCVGLGHSNLAWVPTRMEKTLQQPMHALIFCASAPTKAERPGFISNSTPIRISGCRL